MFMSSIRRKITIPIGIGYGLTDLMGGGAFTIIGAWLLFFYTTYAGLSPIEAASIVGIARIVDSVISLFIGSISDNFFSNSLGRKFGRRRFFLLIGSPLMIVFALLWLVNMGFWYYLVCYLAFEVIAALVLIPWETLPAEMTTDFTERTKLSSCRMFISSTGTFLATFVPGVLLHFFGENNYYAYILNGIFFAIVFAICIFISYKVTWEREITPETLAKIQQNQQSSGRHLSTILQVIKDYWSTLKVKAFRQHLLIYLCSFTAKDVFNTVFIFFGVFCLNITSSQAAGILSLSIIGIPTTIIGGFLILRIGPSNLFKCSYISMLVCLLGFLAVYFYNPASKLLILYALGLIYQIGRQLLEFTPWNVFPFIPDVDEMITHKRREGLFAAVMTFTRKTTVAIATIIVGAVLQEGGFVKGSLVQTPEAVSVIADTLFIGTGVLLIIALVIAWHFCLDKHTHAMLMDEMNRLKKGNCQINNDRETQKVIQKLTGRSYQEIFVNYQNEQAPVIVQDEMVLAKQILQYVGGSYNIDYYTYCSTRLRLNINDERAIDYKDLRSLDDVQDARIIGNQLQLVLGNKVQDIYNILSSILKR